jgi:predicted dehydrogenase
MTDRSPFRVGIIGGGQQGTYAARAYHLHPRTEVAAVADTDPENLKLFCERFDVPGYSTYEEMLAKEELDIAAPILPVRAKPGRGRCQRAR